MKSAWDILATSVLGKMFRDPEFRTTNGFYITPFRAQAALVNDYFRDNQLSSWTASSVYAQQGSEVNVVLAHWLARTMFDANESLQPDTSDQPGSSATWVVYGNSSLIGLLTDTVSQAWEQLETKRLLDTLSPVTPSRPPNRRSRKRSSTEFCIGCDRSTTRPTTRLVPKERNAMLCG